MKLYPNHPKILSQKINGNLLEVELADGTFLSQVIQELPAGIINKSETGIGATSCEMQASRCSIIVEPVKATASAKAGNRGVLYFGSRTKKHKGDITKAQIQAFLNNTATIDKKIFVVANSLGKLKSYMTPEQFKTYFLTIDECDKLQLDVNYRSVMEGVMNIYKQHPKELRCLVTATPIKFNDPELKDEPYTVFKYEHSKKRTINLVETPSPLKTAAEEILRISKSNPTEKVVVAFNNVSKLHDLAKTLEDNGIPKKDISIMCGEGSKKNASGYFNSLDGDKLPSKYVLKTSAYYTGYDLNEKYHLYTVVDSSDYLNTLSDDEIKQIAGRARKGLLSENVLHKRAKDPVTHNLITLKELEDAADAQLTALNCIESALGSNKLLKDNMKTVMTLMGDLKTIYGYNLLKQERGVYVKSYLSIDAILHINQVNTSIYNLKDGLHKALTKAGHSVTTSASSPSIALKDTGIAQESYKEEMKQAMRVLKDTLRFPKKLGTHTIGDVIAEPFVRTAKPKQQLVYNTYNDLRKFVESKYLIEHLEKLVTRPTQHGLNTFYDRARFAVISNASTYKKVLSTTIEVGKEYDRADLLERIKRVAKEFGSKAAGKKSDTYLMKQLGLMVEYERKGKNKDKYLIKGYNPDNIPLIATDSEYLTEDEDFKRLLLDNTMFK